MKKLMILGVTLAGMGFLTACGTSSTAFDPSDPTNNTLRAMGTVSHAECMIAAKAAAENAMSSATYDNFLKKFRNEQKDPTAIPLMQVGDIRNNTNDPDLQMNLITDEICATLLNSGKAEVTLATGRDVSKTFADARKLAQDQNFKQSTVAKKNTLEAPRLSMEGSIISNVTKEGRDTVQVYSFNLKIADIETGRVIWTYNKPLGSKKTRPIFGS